MKNILITGVAGYIGSLLCTKFVEEGYKVTAVDILKLKKLKEISVQCVGKLKKMDVIGIQPRFNN